MPLLVEEIVAEGLACADAGAAIVHFHAYDETTGRQRDDWEIYARVSDESRARADVIVYPTIALAGSGLGSHEFCQLRWSGHLGVPAREARP